MSQEISGAVRLLCVTLENDFIRTSFVVPSAKVIVWKILRLRPNLTTASGYMRADFE